MRRKRHKATRRALRFFRINHGFREPNKVRWWRQMFWKQRCIRSVGTIGISKKNHFLLVLSLSRRFFLSSPSLDSLQVLLDGNFVHALRETK